jgi:hypothetical protein
MEESRKMEGILMTKSKIDPKWAKKRKKELCDEVQILAFCNRGERKFSQECCRYMVFGPLCRGIWPLIKAQLAQLKPTGNMVDED